MKEIKETNLNIIKTESNSTESSEGNRINNKKGLKKKLPYLSKIKKNSLYNLIVLIICLYFFVIKKKDDKKDKNIYNNSTSIISDYNAEYISDILTCESGFFIDNNNICTKCPIDNCGKRYEKNNTNFCIFCMAGYVPIYENGIIQFCRYHCETGKDEKCLSCDSDNITCIGCNIGYKLMKGKCIKNNSFTAVYETTSNNEIIPLIYHNYTNDILEMIIDGKAVTPNYEYNFQNQGNHSVYFLLRANITSFYKMFFYIDRMNSISFSKYFDTKNITDMSGMFYRCESLTFIDITNFNTENIQNMSFMFLCPNLISINISNFNTRNVVDMEGMFMTCQSLTSLDVSNFDTKNVKDFIGMFYYCIHLTLIDVSNFNTSNAKNLSFMISDCSLLTSIDISNFNTQNVEFME